MLVLNWCLFFLLPAVVPCLLGCLSCGVREVRRAAVAVLQPLAAVTSSPYHPMLEKLLLLAEELVADPAYLTQVLYNRCIIFMPLEIRL